MLVGLVRPSTTRRVKSWARCASDEEAISVPEIAEYLGGLAFMSVEPTSGMHDEVSKKYRAFYPDATRPAGILSIRRRISAICQANMIGAA